MTRGEHGGESSSRSRSPSSPLQTSWNHSTNLHGNRSFLTGESSSSRFGLRSLSDYSLSSHFSSGLCSSEDGSSQFASPPIDWTMTTNRYNTSLAADDLGLCETFHRLNIGEEENERHQCVTGNHLRNYEPNDGGFRFGVPSGFAVDRRSSLFPNIQSVGENLNPDISCNLGYRSAEIPLSTDRFMVSSPSKSLFDPFISDNSLIMEAKTLNNNSVPSYASGVGRLFDHHHQASSSNTNHPSLPNTYDFVGHVYLMAKDQHGCRFLQRIIEHGTSLDARIVFTELIPHVAELMVDPFGNYLMQKLLDVCNEEQRTQIILVVTAEPGRLIQICLNSYGTRVIQRLVESIKTRKQIFLVKSALRHGFLNLVRDLNGNHVIQRCLKCLSTEDNEFILEDATRFCIDIATHRHGCCVLNKCIAYSTGQRREMLITQVCRNSLFLAQDPYGNYVVQFIIEMRDFSAIAMVLAYLKGHYVELSMQKFSSHLVERCLTHCPESRSQIVRELISVPRFDFLIQDPYANFVIQAALSVTKGSLHATLVEVIRPHSILRNNPYCKRIFSRNLLRN